MIRLTIELVPHGIEEDKKLLHTVEITNTGKCYGDNNNYVYNAKILGGEHVLVTHDRNDNIFQLMAKAAKRLAPLCDDWKGGR